MTSGIHSHFKIEKQLQKITGILFFENKAAQYS